MSVRARRGLAVVAVGLAAALSLAGCSAHPGAAAVVGDRTISQDELARTSREIGPLLQDASPSAMLGALVVAPTYLQTAKDHGVGVSDDQARAILAQASKSAGVAEPAEWGRGALDYAKVVIASQGLQQLDGGADIIAGLKTELEGLHVTLNPQYGTWKDGSIAPLSQPWIAAPDAAAATAPAAP